MIKNRRKFLKLKEINKELSKAIKEINETMKYLEKHKNMEGISVDKFTMYDAAVVKFRRWDEAYDMIVKKKHLLMLGVEVDV